MKSILKLAIPLLLLTQIASAKLIKQDAIYCDGSTTLQGYMVTDSAWKGTRPAVLIVHDWDGLGDYEKMRAEMIAGLGYVAFAVDVYGKDNRPTNPQESGKLAGQWYADRSGFRNRLKAAFDHVHSLPNVNKHKIAALGYCFGGSGVLEMARSGLDLTAVVSFHGGLKTPMPAKKGEVKANVLVLSGAADAMAPPADIENVKAEFTNAGVPIKVITYPHALHAFTVKGSERSGNKNVGYNEAADKASWIDMKTFLAKVFK